MKIWLDALTDPEKNLTKLALQQWINWATADTKLSESNYAGSDPKRDNLDVMNGEVLQDGTSGRNISATDAAGMKDLYDGKTWQLTYVDEKAAANFTIEKVDIAAAQGGPNWNAKKEIESGFIKIPNNPGTVGGNPPINRLWYYVTDSDKDGKITNGDKDSLGKLISEYTTVQGTDEYYTHMDFYSQVKHEIGHVLGFDHSSSVPKPIPEPATWGLLGVGSAGLASVLKKRKSAS